MSYSVYYGLRLSALKEIEYNIQKYPTLVSFIFPAWRQNLAKKEGDIFGWLKPRGDILRVHKLLSELVEMADKGYLFYISQDEIIRRSELDECIEDYPSLLPYVSHLTEV